MTKTFFAPFAVLQREADNNNYNRYLTVTDDTTRSEFSEYRPRYQEEREENLYRTKRHGFTHLGLHEAFQYGEALTRDNFYDQKRLDQA